ncbi:MULTISPECIES: hypothetical protein [Streptomyces]|uniref:hypothetical protein n=1 Tax=Streptomyces TaxID=1883 RepID=UPI001163A029|nr:MULTISPECIES: hypothetical protein [Streptomyces]MCX5356978.1 hypothetical protein [Streptomyces mirabilis]QDN74707.1 hypothetical protein FNV64_02385 [Streptomyces sp. S1A1-7]QDN93301.1 hypothetical protein FNV61_55180 [Streptomyces sp. RLB3-6]QDO05202.1 hypothetical protein FNV68_01310 [Streptomyces sp. S1D4-23]
MPGRRNGRRSWIPTTYVANCRKELVENTADIKCGVHIMHKGEKFGTYIGEKLLLVMKDRMWSADSVSEVSGKFEVWTRVAHAPTDDTPTS